MLLPNGKVLLKNRGVTTGYESTLGDNTAMHTIAIETALAAQDDFETRYTVMGDDNKLCLGKNTDFDAIRKCLELFGFKTPQHELGS